MRTQPFPEPDFWNDGIYYDSVIEAQLQASIEEEYQKQKARQSSPVERDETAPSAQAPIPGKFQQVQSIAPGPGESSLAQLMSGCGIAAVDGYLTIRDYATSKGLDLIEMKHKGINFQDLVSTLIIHQQKIAELEGRESGARRWKR